MNGEKRKRLVFVPVIVSLLLMAGCNAAPSAPPEASPIIIRQSGGASALTAEFQDRDYLISKADYIVEGTVTVVESRWNEERTGIFTYTDFTAVTYLKGTPLPASDFRIVTPGGTVGDITQAVEDQPIFHEGRKVRLYLEMANGRFAIIGGLLGVEGLEPVPVPAPARPLPSPQNVLQPAP